MCYNPKIQAFYGENVFILKEAPFYTMEGFIETLAIIIINYKGFEEISWSAINH